MIVINKIFKEDHLNYSIKKTWKEEGSNQSKDA